MRWQRALSPAGSSTRGLRRGARLGAVGQGDVAGPTRRCREQRAEATLILQCTGRRCSNSRGGGASRWPTSVEAAGAGADAPPKAAAGVATLAAPPRAQAPAEAPPLVAVRVAALAAALRAVAGAEAAFAEAPRVAAPGPCYRWPPPALRQRRLPLPLRQRSPAALGKVPRAPAVGVSTGAGAVTVSAALAHGALAAMIMAGTGGAPTCSNSRGALCLSWPLVTFWGDSRLLETGVLVYSGLEFLSGVY